MLWTKRGRLTISQISDWRKKPRNADFRDEYALSNMRYLFKEMEEEIKTKSERKHLLLLHGYQELSFCYLTVPHGTLNRHLAWSPNLLKVAHVATPERAKEEGPTDSPEPEALENLRRMMRDNDHD